MKRSSKFEAGDLAAGEQQPSIPTLELPADLSEVDPLLLDKLHILGPQNIGEKSSDNGERKKHLQESLKAYTAKAGHNVDNEVFDVLVMHPEFSIGDPEHIHLAYVSVADLGFSDGATYGQVVAEGQKRGLKLVTDDTGPRLRMDYEHQQSGEKLLMAMNVIPDSFRDLVFRVSTENDQRYIDCFSLQDDRTREGVILDPSTLIVFRLPG